MTNTSTIRASHQPQNRVPHLRDSLIVDKVGIVRKHDRLPQPINKSAISTTASDALSPISKDAITSTDVSGALSSVRKDAVISTEATDSFIVRRAVERPPHFVFAAAFAFASASEIGPGFSPDIKHSHNSGFSPWGMPSRKAEATA